MPLGIELFPPEMGIRQPLPRPRRTLVVVVTRCGSPDGGVRGRSLWCVAAVADLAVSSDRVAGLARGSAVSSGLDRKSTRLNSSHSQISYAVFCLKKKKKLCKEAWCRLIGPRISRAIHYIWATGLPAYGHDPLTPPRT